MTSRKKPTMTQYEVACARHPCAFSAQGIVFTTTLKVGTEGLTCNVFSSFHLLAQSSQHLKLDMQVHLAI